MPSVKRIKTLDIKTEDRIKTAARKVFHKKGYSATRTRDIAEAADINLALLNYYFRSKKKLFDLIMLESLTLFLQNMGAVFNDEKTSLEKKLQLIAENYIDMLLVEPEIPLFVMSEIRNQGAEILNHLPLVNSIFETAFVKQYKKAVRDGKISGPNPIHFILNMGGLVFYPFIARPLVKKTAGLTDKGFEKLMLERKKLIPVWLKALFNAT